METSSKFEWAWTVPRRDKDCPGVCRQVALLPKGMEGRGGVAASWGAGGSPWNETSVRQNPTFTDFLLFV